MPRKLRPPGESSSFSRGDMGLAVKDGLREARFHLKRGARKLVEGVQTAIHPAGSEPTGPLALLTPPVEMALRTAVQLLRTADHAAIDLLSSDGRYRSMDVPLAPSCAYFSAQHAVDPIRSFTSDHGWRYRHLLALREEDTMFVHEQQIERVGRRLRAAVAGDRTNDLPQRLNARIAIALAAAEVLTPAIDVESELHDEARALNNHLAFCAVLAGEIAQLVPGPVKQQTTAALRLADEICMASRDALKRAAANPNPDAAFAAWMVFALRHV